MRGRSQDWGQGTTLQACHWRQLCRRKRVPAYLIEQISVFVNEDNVTIQFSPIVYASTETAARGERLDRRSMVTGEDTVFLGASILNSVNLALIRSMHLVRLFWYFSKSVKN